MSDVRALALSLQATPAVVSDVLDNRQEIGRLQGLVHKAAADLRELGADTQAHRLLRALEGR